MSLKHLGTGSQQPPKVDGLLRLYSMQYCPFAQRNRLILLVKNLPHEIVNINLRDKPEWYFKIHPEGKVPVLDTGSEIVAESLVISDYLDEKYPNPPLYPKDPAAKKRDQELIQNIERVTSVFYKIVYGDQKKSLQERAEEVVAAFEVFESALAERGTLFFGGDKPGIVDYNLWPWSERIGVLALGLGENLPFKEEQNVYLKKWHKAMLEDPAVKATFNDPERHFKIIELTLKNSPKSYDDIQ